MIIIDDLLYYKERNLYIMLNGKKIPMKLNYYVADDIFFFEVDKNAELHTLEDLRITLENEAEDECWNGDIYEAPMEKISSCEIRFPKDFSEVIEKDIFYNYYTVTHISTTEDDIIIHLK